MAARREIIPPMAMASRWRKRPICVLTVDQPVPAALRELSARGAFLETNARPALGTMVSLSHPEAGTIAAVVSALAGDGIRLRFERSPASMAFAMAALAADMTRPG